MKNLESQEFEDFVFNMTFVMEIPPSEFNLFMKFFGNNFKILI